VTFPGTQPLGIYGAPQPLTIANTGHGDLRIETARIAGDVDDFAISSDVCSRTTLPAGQTCTLRLRFGPSAGGTRWATVDVTSNDPSSPLHIPVEGIGGELPRVAGVEKGPSGPAGETGASASFRRGPVVRVVQARKSLHLQAFSCLANVLP
jgi:hypothetical protein